MAEPNYKYQINHYYNQLPKSVTHAEVVKKLLKSAITERTFYRDRALLASDDSDIPATRLRAYAQFFGVPIEKLFNSQPKVERLKKTKTGLR